jgi:hypothetical protein
MRGIDPAMISEILDRTLAAAAGERAAPEAAGAFKDIGADLAQALAAGHLSLRYQPIMDRNGEFAGKAEALVSWNCPDRGFRPPDEFIPALEANGVISKLTDFVLERAMREALARDDVHISVNASAGEFQQLDFPDRIAEVARLTTSRRRGVLVDLCAGKSPPCQPCVSAWNADARIPVQAWFPTP